MCKSVICAISMVRSRTGGSAPHPTLSPGGGEGKKAGAHKNANPLPHWGRGQGEGTERVRSALALLGLEGGLADLLGGGAHRRRRLLGRRCLGLGGRLGDLGRRRLGDRLWRRRLLRRPRPR